MKKDGSMIPVEDFKKVQNIDVNAATTEDITLSIKLNARLMQLLHEAGGRLGKRKAENLILEGEIADLRSTCEMASDMITSMSNEIDELQSNVEVLHNLHAENTKLHADLKDLEEREVALKKTLSERQKGDRSIQVKSREYLTLQDNYTAVKNELTEKTEKLALNQKRLVRLEEELKKQSDLLTQKEVEALSQARKHTAKLERLNRALQSTVGITNEKSLRELDQTHIMGLEAQLNAMKEAHPDSPLLEICENSLEEGHTPQSRLSAIYDASAKAYTNRKPLSLSHNVEISVLGERERALDA